MHKKLTTLLAVLFAGISAISFAKENDNALFILKRAAQPVTVTSDACYQVATLQSLVKGNYDGYETIGKLLTNGDCGLGTFDKLNGEMIVVDGKCYRGAYDGRVTEVPADETTPFASVKWLHADVTDKIKGVPTLDALKVYLDGIVEAHGTNSIYIGRVDGSFSNIKYRSEFAQQPPYKDLASVIATDQTEFVCDTAKGTLVAVYMPKYMENVNTPGWHLHFVDDKRELGGHVLAVTVDRATLTLDQADSFVMTMPAAASFQDMDLMDVSKDDIQKVEMDSK